MGDMEDKLSCRDQLIMPLSLLFDPIPQLLSLIWVLCQANLSDPREWDQPLPVEIPCFRRRPSPKLGVSSHGSRVYDIALTVESERLEVTSISNGTTYYELLEGP